MGSYDDLIPGNTATPTKPKGSIDYSDLYPAGKTPANTPNYGRFADLVPKPEPAPAPKPNIVQRTVSAASRGIGKVSDTISKAVAEPAPQEAGRIESPILRTLRYLPSSLADTMTFGITEQLRNDPELAKDVTLKSLVKETPGALLETLKGFVKMPLAGGASLVQTVLPNKDVSFNIPGLGKIDSHQVTAASRIANGEDPSVVMIQEGASAILDVLFLADIVARVAAPRARKVFEGEGDFNNILDRGTALDTGPQVVKGKQPKVPIDNGPRSFRLYEAPTAYYRGGAMTFSEAEAARLRADGIKIEPNRPTYFRVVGGKGGSFKRQVIQLDPSYLGLALAKLRAARAPKPGTSLEVVRAYAENPHQPTPVEIAAIIDAAKPTEKTVVATKEVKLGEVQKALENPKLETKPAETPAEPAPLPKEVAPYEDLLPPEKVTEDALRNIDTAHAELSQAYAAVERPVTKTTEKGSVKIDSEAAKALEQFAKEAGSPDAFEAAVNNAEFDNTQVAGLPGSEAAAELARLGGSRAFYESVNGPAVDAGSRVSRAQEALDMIRTEMLDLSRAGYRVTMSYGKDAQTYGVPSTFPEWVPEHLRRAKLFQKVFEGLQSIDTLRYPSNPRATAQRALVDEIFNTLDARLGIDTRAIRDRITGEYERIANTRKEAAAKAGGRSAAGSVRRGGKKRGGKEEEAGQVASTAPKSASSKADSGKGASEPSSRTVATEEGRTEVSFPDHLARMVKPSRSFSSFSTIQDYVTTNIEIAKENLPTIKKAIEEVTGVTPEARVKEPDTLEDKIKYEQSKGRDPDEIRDILGARIVVPEGGVPAVMKKIQDAFSVNEKRSIDYFEKPSAWGYRGINLAVELPGGGLFELQVHTPASKKIDSIIKPYYDKWRRKNLTDEVRAQMEQDRIDVKKKADAEAMARDVIKGREFRKSQQPADSEAQAVARLSELLHKEVFDGITDGESLEQEKLAEELGLKIEEGGSEGSTIYVKDRSMSKQKAADIFASLIRERARITGADYQPTITKDGSVVAYHGTTEANAEKLLAAKSHEDTMLYVSPSPGKEAGGVGGAQEYGSSILKVTFDPRYAEYNGLGEIRAGIVGEGIEKIERYNEPPQSTGKKTISKKESVVSPEAYAAGPGKALSGETLKAFRTVNGGGQLYKKIGQDEGGDLYEPVIGAVFSKVEDADRAIEMIKKVVPSMPSGGNYSIGSFSKDIPLTLGGVDKLKIIEFPELVDLARELMGEVPKVRTQVSKVFGGLARGVFYGAGGGEIRLRADLFDPKVNDITQVAKTLAHEIGHLIDYLPERTLLRGNILGRLTSLMEIRNEFIPEAGVSRADKEVRQEMWNLSNKWRPLEKTIQVEETNIEDVGGVPTEVTKMVDKVVPATESELPAKFIEYRKSSKELYADFVSALFNDPKLVEEIAPTAYNLFFEHLDKKPAVRDAYFELQAKFSGDRDVIIKARREGVQQMFKMGDYKSLELQRLREAERQQRRTDLFTAFKFGVVSTNYPMIERVKRLEAQGEFVNPDDNPVYYMEERNYLGGKIKVIIDRDFNSVFKSLQRDEITWDTFGEYVFYERIAKGDRSSQANPRGITPAAAEELIADIKSGMTGKQIATIEKAADDFRAGVRKVAEEAYREGLYTPELYKQMQENPAYVTYQVIDHLEAGVTSRVHKSIGTLKDITNPADATILKLIATVRAIERNKVTRQSIEFLKRLPGEVEDAQSVFNGKNGQRFIAKKGEPETEPVIYYEKGKAKGYYVDPYIKMSIERSTIGENKVVLSALSPLSYLNRKLFRPLFVTYNPGFQAFNAIRDFKRYWKNIPDMTLWRAMKRYKQAFPLAYTRAFGAVDGWEQAAKDLEMLEERQVLSVTFNDIAAGHSADDTQIEKILRTSGIEEYNNPKQRSAALRPFVAILSKIKQVGDLIETLPKAAGFYELTDGKPPTKDQASYIRRYLGSPDFLDKGYLSPATNEMFLFSNAITQGIRADVEIATMPKTRGAYWWKTAKTELVPKLLMIAAAVGLFGTYVKQLMDDASEYDKTNYTIIPLGRDANGNAVYFRLPSDETGRFIGGLIWKAFSAPTNDVAWTTDLAQTLSYMGGQVPSVSPTITTGSAIYDYLSGQNPYDSFRGRNVLSDDVFKAGGLYANKAMAAWVFNQLGGGIFYRFTTEQLPPREESIPEKVLDLPVISNIAGRFVRVTTYGRTEQLKQIAANQAAAEARARLERRSFVNKYVRMLIEDPSLNRREIELQMVSDRFGRPARSADEIKEARTMIQNLRLSTIKGTAGPEIDALIAATSNDQKEAILASLKETMKPEDYTALLNQAAKDSVISGEVKHNAR